MPVFNVILLKTKWIVNKMRHTAPGFACMRQGRRGRADRPAAAAEGVGKMASIGSLMGNTSATSSIYGSRNSNIISGLASGLDTESMIEGMVQGYQQKITKLEQDRTVLQWQQEAYQSVSNKLVEFARKYTSYTSSTNLLSASFFNKAVLTTANGAHAGLVSASGKSSSSVVLNAVAQLATAARYSHSASGLDSSIRTDEKGNITMQGSKVDLNEDVKLSTMSGSLSITYGNQEITLDFDELDLFNKDGSSELDTEKLQKAIEEKLSEQSITTSSGDTVKASTKIGVSVALNGTITLEDKSGAGNSVYISGATGDFGARVENLEDAVDSKSNTFKLDSADVTKDVKALEYLSGKTLTVSLNGQSKTITLPKWGETGTDANETFQKGLQDELDKAFGAGKITVGRENDGFTFQVGKGSTLSVTSSVGEAMGLGENGLTSYLNTGKTLGEIGALGTKTVGGETVETLTINGVELQGTLMKVDKDSIVKQEDGTYTDLNGNAVDENGVRLGRDGKALYSYELTINGESVGSFNRDTALDTVINSVNNSEAGVSVNYSQLTNQFVFTAKETGEGGRIEIAGGTLGAALFGAVDPENLPEGQKAYTAGQDAIFQATINGETMTFSRSSNTFEADGMTITFSGTFNNVERSEGEGPIKSEELAEEGFDKKAFVDGEDVTFTSKTDADTIVEAVKSMVEDYNKILTEVKKLYSDMPLKKSDGSKYDPLTDEERADWSDSAIEAYEEKAKTGILFMDGDLSSLYSALRSAITPGGADGSLLRSIGISTSYEDGLTTISLDEEKLRTALENDPESVKTAFTKSKENGAGTDGLMTSIQKVTDRFAATTGAVKGILIEKAGSQYSPTAALDNTMLNKMEDIDEEISKWQDKMADKVDYYTNKFTQLEMLIQQMNSQSSSLAGLMGGY